MLSPVSSSNPYLSAGPLAQQMRAGLPSGSAIGALAEAAQGSGALSDAANVAIGTKSAMTLISNYGLPREVIIARRASAANEVGQPDLGRDASGTEPWMLSIASRYIGTYETSTKAVSAAMNLTA